jgi:hypothetical protein
MSHTPGPWVIDETDSSSSIVQTVKTGFAVHEHPEWGSINSRVEIRENARLIAAAPELLEKLEALLAMARRNIKGALLEVAMADAEQVINKARSKA